ncbi:TIGR02597 family protein [Puniceicoccaceae bacterium K14]|nr:TIGR02597 family protein [Puniceicoccaceae bacterium K14]
MKNLRRFRFVLVTIVFMVNLAASVEATSISRYGYLEVDLPAGSDTYISIPFNNDIAAKGVLKSAPIMNAQEGLVALAIAAADVSWEEDEFKDLYYVRILDGDLEGLYFTVRSNSDDNLIVDDQGIDFSTVTSGTLFELAPYWTLETLFPSSSDTGLTASFGLSGRVRRSQILYPSLTGEGINLAPSRIFFFTSATGWLDATSGFSDASNVILYPDSYVIVRQPSSLADAKMLFRGAVNDEVLTLMFHTDASSKQDNYVSLNRPNPVSLKDSGIASGFTDSTSFSGRGRRDELLLFDNESQTINKSPSKIFYTINGTWYSSADRSVADDFLLMPSDCFIIRKWRDGGNTHFAKTYLSSGE